MADLTVFTGPEGGGGAIADPFPTNGITSKAGSDLTIEPVVGKITKFGSAFVTSHGLAGNDDVGINGNLECNGLSYFDAGLTVAGGAFTSAAGSLFSGGWNIFNQATRHSDNIGLVMGSGSDTTMYYNTFQTPDALMLAVGVQSRSLLFVEKGKEGDYAHAIETNPTLFIQSATGDTQPTECLRLCHNTVDGEVTTEKGGILFSCPAAVPTPTANSQWTAHINEGGNLLTFTVKYSGGAVKTGTLAVA